MFDAIKAWFTPERRKLVYALGTVGGALLIASGIITPEQVNKGIDALTVVSGVVLALTNVLASANVNKVDCMDDESD